MTLAPAPDKLRGHQRNACMDSHEINPYSPPSAHVEGVAASSMLQIRGKCLLVPRDSALPPICILSGKTLPGGGVRVTKKLYWMSPWLYLSILLSVLVFIVLGLIFRKSSEVIFSLSDAENARLRKRRLIAGGVFLAGLAAMIAGVSENLDVLALIGGVAMLAGLVILAIFGRTVWAQKIDGRHIHLRGISDAAMRAMVRGAGAA